MSGLRMATVELPEERVTMAVEGEEVVLQLQGAWPASQPASRAEPGRGEGPVSVACGTAGVVCPWPTTPDLLTLCGRASRFVAVPHALWPRLTLCGRVWPWAMAQV
jgi:hypothetical protein